MSLFQTLYTKKKDKGLENFLTEIVAYLFQSDHDLMFSWISKLDINQNWDVKSSTSVQVTTQPNLAGKHPDILVILNKGNQQKEFLSEEDNLNSIKKFYLDRLDELAQVQKEYSKLPWNK